MYTKLIGLRSIEDLTVNITLFTVCENCSLEEGAVEVVIGKYFDPVFKGEFFSLTISYYRRDYGKFIELPNKKGITCSGGGYTTKHFREVMKDFLQTGSIVGYIHNDTVVICKNNEIGSFFFTEKDIQNLLESPAVDDLLNTTFKVSKAKKYKRKLLWKAVYKKVSELIKKSKSDEQ